MAFLNSARDENWMPKTVGRRRAHRSRLRGPQHNAKPPDQDTRQTTARERRADLFFLLFLTGGPSWTVAVMGRHLLIGLLLRRRQVSHEMGELRGW